MSALVRSPNLRLIPSRRGGMAAYHTLFGNLRHISERTAELCSWHETPRRTEELDPGRWGPDLADAIGDLVSLHYLVPADRDVETPQVRDWLERRERLIPTGHFITEVELSISDLCNFRCAYCFADVADRLSDDRQRLHRSPDRLMTYDMAERIIDRTSAAAAARGRPRMVVKFIGREPLLNVRVLRQVLERVGPRRNGVALDYSLTTNCSYVTDELAEFLSRHRVTCNVSLDIPGEGNDLTRLTSEGVGTYAVVDRAIRAFRRYGNTVIINSIFTRDNLPHLDGRLLDYASENGVALVNIVPVLAMDEIAAHTYWPNEVICDRLEDLYRYSRTAGVPVRSYWLNGVTKLLASRGKSFLDRVDDRTSCVASGNQLNIEPSGDIFPCRMSGVRFGHIDDLAEALSGPAYRHYLMRTFTDACRGCDIEGFCHGLCVGHLEDKFGDIYRTDDGYCNMYREMTRRVLALL